MLMRFCFYFKWEAMLMNSYSAILALLLYRCRQTNIPQLERKNNVNHQANGILRYNHLWCSHNIQLYPLVPIPGGENPTVPSLLWLHQFHNYGGFWTQFREVSCLWRHRQDLQICTSECGRIRCWPVLLCKLDWHNDSALPLPVLKH